MSSAFNLSVCPHDTAKHAAEWFQFNAYLQQKLDCSIHFKPQDDFVIERQNVLGGGFHIVYANPLSAWTFRKELGFIPVAKAAGVYDEVVLVTRAGAGSIPSHRPLKVATASDEFLIHILGLAQLERMGIARDACDFLRLDSWMKTVHALIRGEADLGFLFNDAWQAMGSNTKSQIEAIAESTDRIAFHSFCIAPECAERKSEIQQILTGMGADPKGQAILSALQFSGIESVDGGALDKLQPLIERYRPGS